MPTLVVPFRGTGGKSRLEPLADDVRAAVAHAMLADVLAASAAVGPTFLVAPEAAASATHVADPRRGQGAAVVAALDAAVGVGSAPPFVVVNADLPCVRARVARPVPAALRSRQRRAVRGPGPFAARGRAESRRRRRHDRRSRAPRATARLAHATRVRAAPPAGG